MENYFGFALKKVAEDIMDIFNGKLLFSQLLCYLIMVNLFTLRLIYEPLSSLVF